MPKVTMHPSSLMMILDKEADAWALETRLSHMVGRMSSDPETQKVLMRFAKQCFVEGVCHGGVLATKARMQSEKAHEATGE